MTRTRRSLILVTIDCLRADHVGFLGYSGQTTPFLDSLAKESFVFTNAIASGVPTYYSLPALLASRYPLALGRDIIGMAPGENTIATELKEYGFKTAGFIAANPYISADYGYDQGFDTFKDFLNDDGLDFGLDAAGTSRGPIDRTHANRFLSKACHWLPLLGEAYDELYFQYCQKATRSSADSLDSLRRFPSADIVVDCATTWLDEHSAEPFFLWIHLMDPHAPYFPKTEALAAKEGETLSGAHAQYLNAHWARADLSLARLHKKRKDILNLYDSGIGWADFQIERLIQKTCELGLFDQCAIAVTADHGEEFLDHGGKYHAPLTLHQELVHVPLLLRIPGVSERRDVDSAVGLIDLAPTLLEALEISTPASFRGRSCWRQIQSGVTWERPVITECAYGCSNPAIAEKRLAPRLLAVRYQRFKLVVNFALGLEQLFDLQSDPHELSPLPLGTSTNERRYLLSCAEKHVKQSYKSRSTDLRFSAQLSELRRDWAQTPADRIN